MSAFQTGYSSGGSGSNYHFLTFGSEDDLFFLGAKHTQFKQRWNKYTCHSQSMIIQTLANQGCGHTMSAGLIKTPDYLYKSYLLQFYPGIVANVNAGASECSWVNAAGLYAIKQMSIKIGSQPIFSMNGHAMMVLMELAGDLDKYASMIGFHKTKAQLISESKRDRKLFAPFVGFPFHERQDLVYSIGAIAFHGVTAEIQTRPLNEMVVNYGGVVTNKGMFSIPKEIATNNPLTAQSVQFALGTNCIWVSSEERMGLIHGYNESIFRECLQAADVIIQSSNTAQRVNIDLNLKGPCAFIAVTIQSTADLAVGNHTKMCQDSGEDWITEIMLITGSVPREDGLPAEFYRTGKIIEAFKTSIDRHIYVFSFETDATSRQMTGHQNMTNVEKLQLSAQFVPHVAPLKVIVHGIIYNGWYTENGTGGKIWG